MQNQGHPPPPWKMLPSNTTQLSSNCCLHSCVLLSVCFQSNLEQAKIALPHQQNTVRFQTLIPATFLHLSCVVALLVHPQQGVFGLAWLPFTEFFDLRLQVFQVQRAVLLPRLSSKGLEVTQEGVSRRPSRPAVLDVRFWFSGRGCSFGQTCFSEDMLWHWLIQCNVANIFVSLSHFSETPKNIACAPETLKSSWPRKIEAVVTVPEKRENHVRKSGFPPIREKSENFFQLEKSGKNKFSTSIGKKVK